MVAVKVGDKVRVTYEGVVEDVVDEANNGYFTLDTGQVFSVDDIPDRTVKVLELAEPPVYSVVVGKVGARPYAWHRLATGWFEASCDKSPKAWADIAEVATDIEVVYTPEESW